MPKALLEQIAGQGLDMPPEFVRIVINTAMHVRQAEVVTGRGNLLAEGLCAKNTQQLLAEDGNVWRAGSMRAAST